MIHIDGDPNISIRVSKKVDKPGKDIILVFDTKLSGHCEILLDNRCLGKNTKACDGCKLKFRCYSGDAIRINFDEELAHFSVPAEHPTLGEVVQWYLKSKGVDPDLTKVAESQDESEVVDEAEGAGVIKKLLGTFKNQIRCPECGKVFTFDYANDTGRYECPECDHKWKKT